MINDTEFELIYNIVPNKRYSFNQISLNLPLDFEQKNFDDLNNFFGKLKGKQYSLFTIEKILDEIDKIILDKEYKTLESKVDENVYEDKIDLTFTISEGKKYSIDRINIYGNNITQENVIRNQLLICLLYTSDAADEY